MSDKVPDGETECSEREKVVGLRPEGVVVGVALLDNDAVDRLRDLVSDAEGERGLKLSLEDFDAVNVGGYVTDPVGVTLSLQLCVDRLMDPATKEMGMEAWRREIQDPNSARGGKG